MGKHIAGVHRTSWSHKIGACDAPQKHMSNGNPSCDRHMMVFGQAYKLLQTHFTCIFAGLGVVSGIRPHLHQSSVLWWVGQQGSPLGRGGWTKSGVYVRDTCVEVYGGVDVCNEYSQVLWW